MPAKKKQSGEAAVREIRRLPLCSHSSAQDPEPRRTNFLLRYLVTLLVAFLLLFLFDKAPLDELVLTLTRTILVAFPASFAATAVDFMK